MAFLTPAVRWPDALPVALPDSDGMLRSLRPFLGPLGTLPAPLLLALLFLLPGALLLLLRLGAPASPQAVPAPRVRRVPHVLLAGPSGAGKTALWHALAHDGAAVPNSTPSQAMSRCESRIQGRNCRIVDVPGHARLRHLAEKEVGDADALVFCVDAGAGRQGGEGMREAADQLHTLLSSASKRRTPLSLLVLFTRADLSPLLTAGASDAKRRNAALQRATTQLEAEMTRRRTGLGVNAQSAAAKVGALRAVAGGGGGVFAPLWRALGLDRSSGQASQDDDEGDEEERDYVAWAALGSAAAASFSFERLEPAVCTAGVAQTALASVGTRRGWALDEGIELTLKDEKPLEWDGLLELRAWCAAL